MKLVKLTESRGRNTYVYISADQIIGLTRERDYSGNQETILYTSLRALQYKVLETPEEIERLANS